MHPIELAKIFRFSRSADMLRISARWLAARYPGVVELVGGEGESDGPIHIA